ncbi:MAG: hypothetical protein ACYCR5_11240 [Leptospirillum sp.]
MIDGGFPDFEERKQRDIGRYFQMYQAGEPLPDPLVIGGLRDDLFADAIPELHSTSCPLALAITEGAS